MEVNYSTVDATHLLSIHHAAELRGLARHFAMLWGGGGAQAVAQRLRLVHGDYGWGRGLQSGAGWLQGQTQTVGLVAKGLDRVLVGIGPLLYGALG